MFSRVRRFSTAAVIRGKDAVEVGATPRGVPAVVGPVSGPTSEIEEC
jgi:hypothetical protein